jgi:endonuclease III
MGDQNIFKILELLKTVYPDPKTELENWKEPFQFLACVILSAQATDKGVNKVTPTLFSKFNTINDFADADINEVMECVKSINYFKTKSQRIKNAAIHIRDEFHGNIPLTIEELIHIPGIGRKSANVILNEVFNLSQGVVVDTHVTRVSNRLGLTNYKDQKDAEKIEAELKDIVPKESWRFYSSAIVLHGRYVCKAKNPNCAGCVLNKICPSAFKV